MSSSVAVLERLMTVAEVTEHLRISRSMLYQLIRDGEVKAVKLGRKTLFRATAVQAFIESRERREEPAGLVGRR